MLPSDPASNQPFTLYLLHYRIRDRQKLFRECGPKQDQPGVYHSGSSCWHAYHKWDGNNRQGQRGFTFTCGLNSRGLLCERWFSTSTLSSPVAISQHKSSSTLSSPCKTILLSRDPSSFMKKMHTPNLTSSPSPKRQWSPSVEEKEKRKKI